MLQAFLAMLGPVAMLPVGFTVASYPLTSLLKKKKVYVATVLRLLVIPTVILAAMALLSHTLCVLTIPLLFALSTILFGTPSI